MKRFILFLLPFTSMAMVEILSDNAVRIDRNMYAEALLRQHGDIVPEMQQNDFGGEGFPRITMEMSVNANSDHRTPIPDMYRIIIAVVLGLSSTVLICTAFMVCSPRWDKWVTRKYAGQTVFIAQHFDQDGSSHLSEVILRTGSSQVEVEEKDEEAVSDDSHSQDNSVSWILMHCEYFMLHYCL